MAIVGRANATKPTGRPVVAQSSAGPKTNGMTPPISAKEAKVTVEQTLLENGTVKGEPVTASEMEIKQFVTSTANVGVGVQYTRNLGNFESVKINVMVNMPCYAEEVDNAFAQVLDKAKLKLEEALETLQIAPSEPAETIEAGEGTAETTEVATEEASGDIDLDYLKTANLETLTAIANDNDLGVSAADYAEEDDLRQVLIQAILGEETLQAYLAESGATEQTGGEAYTEEELQKGTTEELKGIYADWDLGAFPKGPTAIARKAAIKKILAKQAEA